MNVPDPTPPNPETVKALLQEIDHAQAGIARTYDGIYKLYGIALPIVGAVFAHVAKDLELGHPKIPIVATFFVVVVAVSGLWAQCMWMDLFAYVRFKYVVLMPTLYRTTNQTGATSFMDWSAGRSRLWWIPIQLFNLGCLAVLVVTHLAFICRNTALSLLSIAFITATVVSTLSVFAEAA